jgi:hypothetical protein
MFVVSGLPLTPIVDWAKGEGDNCEGTQLEAIVAITGVAGGRIPPFDEILSCAARGCIFFICVCTEIVIPFIMEIAT